MMQVFVACVCVYIDNKASSATERTTVVKTMSHMLTGEEHISTPLSSVWYTTSTKGQSFNPCG